MKNLLKLIIIGIVCIPNIAISADNKQSDLIERLREELVDQQKHITSLTEDCKKGNNEFSRLTRNNNKLTTKLEKTEKELNIANFNAHRSETEASQIENEKKRTDSKCATAMISIGKKNKELISNRSIQVDTIRAELEKKQIEELNRRRRNIAVVGLASGLYAYFRK